MGSEYSQIIISLYSRQNYQQQERLKQSARYLRNDVALFILEPNLKLFDLEIFQEFILINTYQCHSSAH
ncbi:unnamed protein product [Trichobilharzia szidati]|nr:unnamed protein product [Trichobilharzia szidati]